MIARRICNLSFRIFRQSTTSASNASSLMAEEPQIWPEVKSLTARLADASSPSIEASFQELERFGYARLNAEIQPTTSDPADNSIKTMQSFPLKVDHVRTAIRKVLDSKTLDDPIAAAWRLAASLVEMRLAKLEDLWLLDLVRADLSRNSTNPEVTLQVYSEICFLHPHLKVFYGSIYELLNALRRADKKNRLYQKGLELAEKLGGRLPRHCINGAILLAEGRSLEFFDELKNDDRSFGVDELRYVCLIAAAVKEPKILEPLVQMHQMLPENRKARHELYNTLAVLYGKRSDFNSLETLWRSLKKQIPLNEMFHYEHVFQRCRHFYRCNNKKVPENLLKILQKMGKIL